MPLETKGLGPLVGLNAVVRQLEFDVAMPSLLSIADHLPSAYFGPLPSAVSISTMARRIFSPPGDSAKNFEEGTSPRV